MVAIKRIQEDMPSEYLYLRCKAESYLILGPEGYREADTFGMPSLEEPEDMLEKIRMGMQQICKLQGWASEYPFEGLEIDGFYALMNTLHFELEMQRIFEKDDTMILDEMRMRHIVTGAQIVLYNRVDK